MRARQSGFTLVEVIVAMVLLGSMMLLLYSGLTFALRSWDAGDVNGRRTAERVLGENFLRRELSELFPMRWKDPTQVKLAFEGEPGRGCGSCPHAPRGPQLGGLSLVGVEAEDDARSPNPRPRDASAPCRTTRRSTSARSTGGEPPS